MFNGNFLFRDQKKSGSCGLVATDWSGLTTTAMASKHIYDSTFMVNQVFSHVFLLYVLE
jgi:hypothetical protein